MVCDTVEVPEIGERLPMQVFQALYDGQDHTTGICSIKCKINYALNNVEDKRGEERTSKLRQYCEFLDLPKPTIDALVLAETR